jgi:hypothetical protein
VHLSFSGLCAEIFNTERCAVYETEAIEKRYLVYKFQDFSYKNYKNIIADNLPFFGRMAGCFCIFKIFFFSLKS